MNQRKCRSKANANPNQPLSAKQRRAIGRQLWTENLELEVVNPDAAGIDIGNEHHYVAVAPRRDEQPVRRFGCVTAELRAMAEWLVSRGIKTVAMQSTGVYWIPAYDVLEASGLKV